MEKVNWKREVLLTGGLFLLVLLLFKGVFNLSAVMGDSMEPSLASGKKWSAYVWESCSGLKS